MNGASRRPARAAPRRRRSAALPETGRPYLPISAAKRGGRHGDGRGVMGRGGGFQNALGHHEKRTQWTTEGCFYPLAVLRDRPN